MPSTSHDPGAAGSGATAATGLPILDLAEFERARGGERARFAAELDAVCRGLGSFVVRGHGVSAALIDRTFAVSNEFFGLSDEQKAKFESVRDNPCWGWSSRSVDETTPVRLREWFEVGCYDNGRSLAEAGYGPEWIERTEPVAWPSQVPGFRTTWTTYLAAMEDLGLRLLEVLAIALELPERWFTDKFDRQMSYLAATRYPVQFEAGRRAVDRVGEHVDFGTLTIMSAEKARRGLQVLDGAGRWIDADAGPSEFVVCVSEMMSRWTDDRWRSAPHRVTSPGDRDPAFARTAMSFYQHPNFDVELAAIPTCVAPGRSPRHPSILAGDLSQSRMNHHELAQF